MHQTLFFAVGSEISLDPALRRYLTLFRVWYKLAIVEDSKELLKDDYTKIHGSRLGALQKHSLKLGVSLTPRVWSVAGFRVFFGAKWPTFRERVSASPLRRQCFSDLALRRPQEPRDMRCVSPYVFGVGAPMTRGPQTHHL